MRKLAVLLGLLIVLILLGIRLMRGDEDPALAGTWRELRPPDFE